MNNKNNDILKQLNYVPRNRVIYARLKAPFAWAANALVSGATALASMVLISALIGGALAAVLSVFVYLSGVAPIDEMLPFFISWTAMFTAGIGGFLLLGRVLSEFR